MSRRNLLTMFLTVIVAYACYVRAEQNPYARYVTAGYTVIDRWSLQRVPDQELFGAAMNGMVEVLRKHGDEHSQFVSAEESEAFREEMIQEFGGVGIRLRSLGNPPLPTVVGPPDYGTPAFYADVHPGDRLIAVDGQPVADIPLEKVTEMVRGPNGERVRLTLTRFDGSKKRDVTLVRSVIMVESILGDLRGPEGRWLFRLSDDARLGYVRITKFGDKTANELSATLASLAADGKPLVGLVLDLRDNYGGALDAAVEISDLFLNAGLPIVTTRGSDKKIGDRYLSTGTGPYPDLPLAVVINRNSASASEIVAACLQDYGRGAVVGERTYGKGTVQRLVKLESGRSLLKITSATYWRPSGRNIHRMPGEGPEGEWGVSPDPSWSVELSEDDYTAWRRYRSRRDLMGSQPNRELIHQLDVEDGALPDDYVDFAMGRAVDALRARLSARAERTPAETAPSGE